MKNRTCNEQIKEFGAYEPKKVILEQIRMQPEVDYEMLYKLITQVCDYFENRHGQNGMQNIAMMNKVSIGKEIYEKNKKGECYCKTRNIIKSEKKLLKLNHRLANIRQNYAVVVGV